MNAEGVRGPGISGRQSGSRLTIEATRTQLRIGHDHLGVGRDRVPCFRALPLVESAALAESADRPPSGHSIALIPTQAMLLDGDHIEVQVKLGPGARLSIVEVSGMVAYPGDDSGASYGTHIDLAEDARLIWKSMPLVIADGAHLERHMSIKLAENARACLRETLVLGRSGESGGWLRALTQADDPEGPVLREDFLADGSHRLPGLTGAAKVVDQLLLLGVDPPPSPTPAESTILTLARPGRLARELLTSAHQTHLGALAETYAALAFDPWNTPRSTARF
jgi:urease accessory protein